MKVHKTFAWLTVLFPYDGDRLKAKIEQRGHDAKGGPAGRSL
jgi:hypothetical protein